MTEHTEIRATTSACLEWQRIGQTVLKWEQANGLSETKLPSGEYLTAMHCLIKRIAQLQSAHEQPQGPITDPEILLPLVLPEAQAVLRQLPGSPDPTQLGNFDSQRSSQPLLSATTLSLACWRRSVQPIRTVASWLLWSIAHSTHDTMQLLEGVVAQVSADRQTWHSGIVRLVAGLEVKTSKTPYALDLVTFQAVPSGLPDECLVQIQAGFLGQQTTSVKVLLQRLAAQLMTTAPILQPFLAGLPVDLLVPQQDWQTGQIQLRLGVEFTAAESLNPSWTAASSLDPLPIVKFTHSGWLEQHITTVVEAQLTQVLVQQKLEATPKETDSEQLVAIIRQGCAAIDQLQHSRALASRTLAQQDFPFDQLALRLLWGMNRTAYGVMQWLSGVPVRLLQPQRDWTTGILRFGVYLVLRTPEQTWCFDLVQRRLGSRTQAVSEAAIVEWCEWGGESRHSQLLSLHDLATEIWQQVSQTMPEIVLLRSETEVSVAVAALPGQLGIIQLQTAFEFSPSGNFAAA